MPAIDPVPLQERFSDRRPGAARGAAARGGEGKLALAGLNLVTARLLVLG